MTQARVLIADDNREVVESLRLLLKTEGFATASVTSPQAVLARLRKQTFDVVLMDMNYTRDTTSGTEGLELLQAIQTLDSEVPVVVITSWGSVERAVEAMRRGAGDFIEKPWDDARLISVIRNQAALGRARRRALRLDEENALLRNDGPSDMVAASPAMAAVMALVERVATADASVLITGENGTGKGVIARRLHALSARVEGPFIRVNLGGLAASLFESELFGHVKGAFTDAKADRLGRFELADGGTLFLDEIGNLASAQQARLLHVLEEGEFERVGSSRSVRVNVRIVAATNANLYAAMEAGRFRRDLYFRLNTVEIHVPPLRARCEDIPLLAHEALVRYSRRYGKRLTGFEHNALAALTDYSWPGNVRELEHIVERAVLLAAGEAVGIGDLRIQSSAPAGAMELSDLNLEGAERRIIEAAMERSGNMNKAADALGVSRSALYRRLQKYNIEPIG
jgi:DNA-binding NtrC family response regulator